jgi:hypothetical protein
VFINIKPIENEKKRERKRERKREKKILIYTNVID